MVEAIIMAILGLGGVFVLLFSVVHFAKKAERAEKKFNLLKAKIDRLPHGKGIT